MDNSQILKEIAVQILGFAIVFFVLKKLAWTNIREAIDARRRYIEGEISAAEQKHKDMEALGKEYQRRLEHIEEEARLKIQAASTTAAVLARDIQERARQDAQKMYDRAKAEIDQDLIKARLTLRNDIVELSGLMTEKIIREKLDEREHGKMVDKFLQEMDKIS